MPFILGLKKEMGRVFGSEGAVIPVTAVFAPSCTVTQVKTKDHDGYEAIQIGFSPLKKSPKSRKGKSFRYLKEFRVGQEELKGIEKDMLLEPSLFEKGKKVTLTGFSKGKGFAGVVKRHHFHGHPPGHGNKDAARMPGSIGQAGVQRVFKGMRMAGRMGNEQVTLKNLEIIEVDSEKKMIYIKGAIPGPRNSLVLIKSK